MYYHLSYNRFLKIKIYLILNEILINKFKFVIRKNKD